MLSCVNASPFTVPSVYRHPMSKDQLEPVVDHRRIIKGALIVLTRYT